METLNSYFDEIYCLNLDEAIERWNNCVEQFNKYNLKVQRFPAIKPESGNNFLLRGEVGAARSMVKMIEEAKKLNFEKILVLEDDFVFVDNFNEVFSNMISQVPDDWDFIYFGGNHVGGYDKISENVAKMKYTYCTHTVGIKNTMFDRIINNLTKEDKAADRYFAEMMATCNAYTFRPTISYQKDGFSFVQNKHVNYDCIKE